MVWHPWGGGIKNLRLEVGSTLGLGNVPLYQRKKIIFVHFRIKVTLDYVSPLGDAPLAPLRRPNTPSRKYFLLILRLKQHSPPLDIAWCTISTIDQKWIKISVSQLIVNGFSWNFQNRVGLSRVVKMKIMSLVLWSKLNKNLYILVNTEPIFTKPSEQAAFSQVVQMSTISAVLWSKLNKQQRHRAYGTAVSR